MHAVLDRATTIDAEIASLGGLSLDGLRTRWRTETGRTAPTHLPKGLLMRLLAYRMQVNCFGDVDPATLRFLQQVALRKGRGDDSSIPLPDGDRVRPGTVLVREWEGTTHRVMALSNGFAWNGQSYASLSEAARAITGTRWNGPRFFGLRKPKKDGANHRRSDPSQTDSVTR